MRVIARIWKRVFSSLPASLLGVAMVLTAVPLMGWPFWHWRGGGGGCKNVAEPTSVLLLGAGLISLAVYAKKKNSKK